MTRAKLYVDTYAPAWLIKRLQTRKRSSNSSPKTVKSRTGAIGFTMPKTEINAVEKAKTTLDVLVEGCRVEDPIVEKTLTGLV